MSENKTSPVAYFFLFLGTAITGSALSFIYLWINRVVPIIYLCILAAVVLGAMMGFVSAKVIQLFKVKSVAPAIAAVVLGCLVFTYFKWALYVSIDARSELNELDSEGLFISAIWFEIMHDEFTDENGVPYSGSEIEQILRNMQETSAYDYGILENELAFWWVYVGEVEFDQVTAAEERELRYISYYDALGFDYLGTNLRIAADIISDTLAGTWVKYINYYVLHGESPTVLYYVTQPVELVDTIIRINSEGRWTYSADTFPRDNSRSHLVRGVVLWLVWLAEFVVICGYAVVAAPKAIKKLNEPEVEVPVSYQVNEYNGQSVNPQQSSFPQPPADWGSGGFGGGGTAEIDITEKVEEFDEHGRPLAKADEFGRLS
jgi:hypothetical protein